MKQDRMSYRETADFCLEMALFLHAGADVAGGLMLLSEESGRREKLEGMAREMDEGSTLSEVMARAGLFPDDVPATVRVGERTGRLEESLRALAEYYDSRDEADRQIRSALVYPSVLFLVMFCVILVLLTKVLPIFSDVYASLGGEMTGAAGGLLRFGHLLDMLMIPICALLALVSAGLAAFSRSQRIRERALCFIGRNRKEGGVPDKMRAARFALALSMGIRSGCSAEEALEAAAGLLGDGAKARCLECLEKAADGEALGELLEEASILPRAECRLLMLGLRSGSGEEAAEEVARRLGRDADKALEQMLGRIEPTMVIIMSLMVGGILLTVMLPLARIMTSIG